MRRLTPSAPVVFVFGLLLAGWPESSHAQTEAPPPETAPASPTSAAPSQPLEQGARDVLAEEASALQTTLLGEKAKIEATLGEIQAGVASAAERVSIAQREVQAADTRLQEAAEEAKQFAQSAKERAEAAFKEASQALEQELNRAASRIENEVRQKLEELKARALSQAKDKLRQWTAEQAPELAALVTEVEALVERGEAYRKEFEAKRAQLMEVVALARSLKSLDQESVAKALYETLGLRRGPPPPLPALGPSYTACSLVHRGRYVPGADPYFSGFCSGFLTVLEVAAVSLPILSPLLGGSEPELVGPSVHHLFASSYLLDYKKKSALTGSLQRPPEGLGVGYDIQYTYDSPTWGLMGYGGLTVQESQIAEDEWALITNYFFKVDAQVGLDFARMLASATGSEYFSWQRMYVRAGPSLFHDFIRLADRGTGDRAAIIDHLNEGVALVTAVGYEVAAEIDFRFPYDFGGVHLNFERGTYPSLSFPVVTPSEATLITMIAFDDLRQGKSYTWQRFRFEVDVPFVFTRNGGVLLGAQAFAYENNQGSGVDNRAFNVSYYMRFN